MKTSAPGRALIEQREGRRLTAYRDSRGIWTIGVGHTGRMSPPVVTPGLTITEAACDACLATDLAPVEAVINAALKVPVSQNEFDAMASLGFNIGAAGLRGSSVIRKLNLGDVQGAAAAFLQWDHPAVLEGRRAAERLQFLQPDAGHDTDASPSISVATTRAQTLAARADVAKRKAVTTANAGGVVTLAGSAVSAGLAHSDHHAIALALAALVLAGAAIDGATAWWHRTQALILAGHASAQAQSAAAASFKS